MQYRIRVVSRIRASTKSHTLNPNNRKSHSKGEKFASNTNMNYTKYTEPQM